MEQSPLLRTVLVLIALCAVVFLVGTLSGLVVFFSDIILILFLAWILATFLRRLARYFHFRFHLPLLAARVLAYLAFLTPFVILLIILVPLTVQQVMQLSDTAPSLLNEYVPAVTAKFQQWLNDRGIQVDLQGTVQKLPLADISAAVFGSIGSNTLAIIKEVGSIIVNGVLTLVIAFYMLVAGDTTVDIIFRVLPAQFSDNVRRVFHQMDTTFTKYLRGMIVIGAIYGTGTLVLMVAEGLPFALPISMLAAILIVLPFIGDLLAISLPILVTLLTSTPGWTLFNLVVLVILQQSMLHYLSPRLLGKAVDLPPLLVMLAVMIGAKLAGFWGAMLGVPMLAAAYYLVLAWIEERNGVPSSVAETVEVQD